MRQRSIKLATSKNLLRGPIAALRGAGNPQGWPDRAGQAELAKQSWRQSWLGVDKVRRDNCFSQRMSPALDPEFRSRCARPSPALWLAT